jgi:hypothetical protein
MGRDEGDSMEYVWSWILELGLLQGAKGAKGIMKGLKVPLGGFGGRKRE